MPRRTRRHSGKPGSRYSDHRKNEKRWGWLLIGGSAAAVIISVATLVLLKAPELDSRTGCPRTHEAPLANTIILIDQTDALPAAELRYARNLIYNEYYWLPLGGQLTILNITAQGIEDDKAIVVCRMRDADEVNDLIQTREAVRRAFERRAGARLGEVLNRMAAMEAQAQSPILESIASLFQRIDFGPDVGARRLVVLSDMAQNSSRYSNYPNGPGFGGAEIDDRYRPNMSGTAVRIQYVRRDSLPFQGAEHQQAWRAYFIASRTRDVAIGHGLQLGEPAGHRVWYNDATRTK